MVWSVYQFCVHGLYSPRHSGLPGYVATTLVMEGVSKSFSASSISGMVAIVHLLLMLGRDVACNVSTNTVNLRIQAIFFPLERISTNVGTDTFQAFVIADNVIVKTWLPREVVEIRFGDTIA